MSFLSLHTGLRSLLASRTVLDTIGHNIANANTPGYSRQRVDLTTSMPLGMRGMLIGTGVDATSIRRSADALLERRTLAQHGVAGRLDALLLAQLEVESLFAEPGGASVSAQLGGFFASVSSLSTSPSDAVLATGVVENGAQLAATLNQIAQSLGKQSGDVRPEAQAVVQQINALAEHVAELNVAIGQTENTGLDANDLRDQRSVLLTQLAQLVDVTPVEDPTSGIVRVLVAGNTLVGESSAKKMSLDTNPGGALAIRVEGATGFAPVTGGKLGGLLALAGDFVPGLQTDLDAFARNLILALNRAHSTGVPSSGAFTQLTGSNALVDVDEDGKVTDELLAKAGLPFDVQSGELWVNVTNQATGALEKHSIAIDAKKTTVGDLLAAINAIGNVSAEVDASQQLRISSSAGFAFDFSAQLDTTPDAAGTFGGGQASLGTPGAEPFALADGDVLELAVGGVPVSIAFSAADFADVGAAGASEVAAAINADPDVQANGLVAVAVDGRVFVQTQDAGSGASFDVVGGSALGALGLGGFAGQQIAGHDNAVDVTIGGTYSGQGNDAYSFVPTGDGIVGTTPGLAVDVFDAAGKKVATLDLGPDYAPGSEIAVAEGVTVSFGLGELSATHNDRFALDLVDDADTSDVLVALGLNSLFTGSSASDIALREDIAKDPTLVASGVSGAAGDNRALLDLLAVSSAPLEGLGGATLEGAYGAIVAGVGFDVAATNHALESSEAVLDSLQLRRDQVAGVNVDEELVDLIRYEQAFGAAVQFISTVNQLQDDLLNLI